MLKTPEAPRFDVALVQDDGHRDVLDCPLCGGGRFAPETPPMPDDDRHLLEEPFRSMDFQMVRCLDCGCIYQRVQPRREDIGRFYTSEYACYRRLSERGAIVRLLSRISVRKLVQQIESLRPPENDVLVDYGCGNGSWLELFREVGAPWRLVGTEISEDLIREVVQLGFEGHVCDDRDVDQVFEPSSVGVVYMHHVIEHVRNPVDLLRRLRQILVPGGIVVGQTPDTDSLERSLFGRYWTQWHVPRHLVLFNPSQIRKHAEAAGLEVVEIGSSPSGATQWSLSILKWWAERRRRHFRLSAEPLHSLLTLLFAPLAMLQSRLGNSSHMDFVLRRPR